MGRKRRWAYVGHTVKSNNPDTEEGSQFFICKSALDLTAFLLANPVITPALYRERNREVK